MKACELEKNAFFEATSSLPSEKKLFFSHNMIRIIAVVTMVQAAATKHHAANSISTTLEKKKLTESKSKTDIKDINPFSISDADAGLESPFINPESTKAKV
ncbi:hypothetical protein GCM10010082_24830 [Kushneria pakistanensis]|uniref:Uncharacterized protein n=1 Tax=Kushneria pakistanensis TaxID=1508770 RepID=A0ABQ3FN81_9GAMM|nr:hypothetical protein GCM10010082_24830 [Kushneria pakistanensis]